MYMCMSREREEKEGGRQIGGGGGKGQRKRKRVQEEKENARDEKRGSAIQHPHERERGKKWVPIDTRGYIYTCSCPKRGEEEGGRGKD